MKKIGLSWLLGAALLCVQPATAQDSGSAQTGLWLSPDLATNFSAPSYFEGLYAGVEFGLINNNFKTFYDSGANSYRIPGGAFVGYNHQIEPWLLAGVELQGDLTVDWTNGATGYSLMGMARLGILTADDFVVYHLAGLGVVNNRAAYAAGVAVEQAISEDFSVRAEMIAYGQLVAPAGVTNYGGFTMMKIAAGAVWHLGNDGEPYTPMLPSAGVLETTDFTGRYVGVYAGMAVNPSYNFFVGDNFNGWHLSRFAQGAVVGWNYAVNDWLRAGAELQAGVSYNTSGTGGFDAEALARLGAIPFEGLLVYGSAGLGVLDGRAAYTLGGGVEYALWGQNTLRLDAQLLGEIQPAPPVIAPGFTATKVTIGTIWHLD